MSHIRSEHGYRFYKQLESFDTFRSAGMFNTLSLCEARIQICRKVSVVWSPSSRACNTLARSLRKLQPSIDKVRIQLTLKRKDQ